MRHTLLASSPRKRCASRACNRHCEWIIANGAPTVLLHLSVQMQIYLVLTNLSQRITHKPLKRPLIECDPDNPPGRRLQQYAVGLAEAPGRRLQQNAVGLAEAPAAANCNVAGACSNMPWAAASHLQLHCVPD